MAQGHHGTPQVLGVALIKYFFTIHGPPHAWPTSGGSDCVRPSVQLRIHNIREDPTSRYWEIIQKHGLMHFYSTPTALILLLQLGGHHIKDHDLSSLHVLGSVGGLINPPGTCTASTSAGGAAPSSACSGRPRWAWSSSFLSRERSRPVGDGALLRHQACDITFHQGAHRG